MSDNKFEDKVVIVTGAASGIGRSIITEFVRSGAKGVIVDLDQEWAEALAVDLRSEGAEVLVCIEDVSKAECVNSMIKAVLDKFGQVDILVNNAGVGVHKEVVELTEAEWDYQVDVQLKGTFLCAQTVARQMIKSGRGKRIINIGSTSAQNARISAAPHCVSKAGVVMLTKVLAMELGKHNITVNCVSPGLTDVSQSSRHGGPSSDYISAFVGMVPLGRLGHSDEIAHAVLFLASEQADFITGQHLTVDGGYSAGKLSVQATNIME